MSNSLAITKYGTHYLQLVIYSHSMYTQFYSRSHSCFHRDWWFPLLSRCKILSFLRCHYFMPSLSTLVTSHSLTLKIPLTELHTHTVSNLTLISTDYHSRLGPLIPSFKELSNTPETPIQFLEFLSEYIQYLGEDTKLCWNKHPQRPVVNPQGPLKYF